MRRLGLATWLGVLGLGVAVPLPAGGDKWALPERTEAVSRDGGSRLTIIPARDFEIGETVPLGVLERKNADGDWTPVWTHALVNRQAPVEAVVADSGRFVVTLDEHGQAGSGENDLVVYGADGRVERRMSLADLFSGEEIAAFPRSVSSIWWRCGASRIGREARLVLLVPRKREEAGECVEVRFELPSGVRVPGARPVDPASGGGRAAPAGRLYSATFLGDGGTAKQDREARMQKHLAASPPLVRAMRAALNRERDEPFAETEREVLAEIQRLVAEGAAVDAVDPNGESALSWALQLYFGNVARFLVERGASLSPPSERGRSVLGEAITLGDAELVRAILARGASPDELPGDHHRPLTLAATFQAEAVLEELLRAGADPNRRGQFESPLEAALRGGWWRGVERLAAAGSDASGLPPDLRLRWAVERGDAPLALEVLAAEPRFDPEEEVLERALCRAAERGDADMIRLLLSRGADPNRSSGLFRTTPLIEAAKMGHLRAIDALLVGGAQVNNADAYGFHPQDVALLFGRDEASKRLLAAGAVEGVSVSTLAGELVLRPREGGRSAATGQ